MVVHGEWSNKTLPNSQTPGILCIFGAVVPLKARIIKAIDLKFGVLPVVFELRV